MVRWGKAYAACQGLGLQARACVAIALQPFFDAVLLLLPLPQVEALLFLAEPASTPPWPACLRARSRLTRSEPY